MDKQPTSAIAQLVATHATASRESLNHRAAAEYLGITPEWLRRLGLAGLAPPSIKVGRERRYLRADLDAWMASRRKAVKS